MVSQPRSNGWLFCFSVVGVMVLQYALCADVINRSSQPLSIFGHFRWMDACLLFWIPAAFGSRRMRCWGLLATSISITCLYALVAQARSTPMVGLAGGPLAVFLRNSDAVLVDVARYSLVMFAITYFPERVFGDIWRVVFWGTAQVVVNVVARVRTTIWQITSRLSTPLATTSEGVQPKFDSNDQETETRAKSDSASRAFPVSIIDLLALTSIAAIGLGIGRTGSYGRNVCWGLTAFASLLFMYLLMRGGPQKWIRLKFHWVDVGRYLGITIAVCGVVSAFCGGTIVLLNPPAGMLRSWAPELVIIQSGLFGALWATISLFPLANAVVILGLATKSGNSISLNSIVALVTYLLVLTVGLMVPLWESRQMVARVWIAYHSLFGQFIQWTSVGIGYHWALAAMIVAIHIAVANCAAWLVLNPPDWSRRAGQVVADIHAL